MGWFSKNKVEKRDLVVEETNVSNGTVLKWLVQNYSAFNISTFTRCVNLISGSVAQLPILVKKKDANGKNAVVKNSPINLLFTDPDNLIDKYTLIKSIVTDVIRNGNGFIYVERGEDGTPIRLRYLQNCDVTINYTKESNKLNYTVSFIRNGKPIQPRDMLHFKLWSFNGINGVSLLGMARKSLDLANEEAEQASSYFQNGCSNLSGILTVNANLSEKQRLQILNTWNQTYSSSKAGLAVLQGNMNYTPLNNSAADSQLLESREYSAAEICQFLGINPAQIGLKGYGGYSSFEDANAEYLQRTLMPFITMLEVEMSRKLLSNEEQNKLKVILDTAAFLRPNKQAESEYYSKLVTNGILNRNEVREILGFGKVKGLDDYVIPFTDIDMNTINKVKEENEE